MQKVIRLSVRALLWSALGPTCHAGFIRACRLALPGCRHLDSLVPRLDDSRPAVDEYHDRHDALLQNMWPIYSCTRHDPLPYACSSPRLGLGPWPHLSLVDALTPLLCLLLSPKGNKEKPLRAVPDPSTKKHASFFCSSSPSPLYAPLLLSHSPRTTDNNTNNEGLCLFLCSNGGRSSSSPEKPPRPPENVVAPVPTSRFDVWASVTAWQPSQQPRRRPATVTGSRGSNYEAIP
ncbi:hypothetical protein FALBO_15299, partial [Fusarium albosuccineum]